MIAIGADGLGLVSYINLASGDLKVAHCDNVSRTSASIQTLTAPAKWASSPR